MQNTQSNFTNQRSVLLDKIEKTAFSFAKQLNTIAGGILIVMMFLAFADVIFRYVFHRPLMGTMELIEIMLATIVSLTYAYAETTRSHFAIDFFTTKLSKTKYALIEAVNDVVALAVILLVSVMLFKYATHVKHTGLITAQIAIPVYIFLYLLALGWYYFALIKFINILKSIKEKGKQFWMGAFIGLVTILICSSIPTIRESFTKLNPTIIGILGTILVIILSFSGMYLGLVMVTIGFLGLLYLLGLGPSLNLLSMTPYRTVASYNYSVYPLFMLMGSIIFIAGIGENIFKCVNKWLGQFAGGIAIATIVGSAFFAAISGSATAMVATMGKTVIPEMRKLKYDDRLASGAIASGGTIGVLIPPSTVLVLYGILTQQPIGKLFIAGFLPGIMKAITYIIVTIILCKKHPDWGPRDIEKHSLKEKIISVKYIWPIAFLFLLVIGGLYRGIFTPTEAAGMGAFGAFFVAVLGGGFSLKKLFECGVDVTKTVGSLFTILIGATFFGYFLAVTRLPFQLADYITSLTINRYLIITIIIIVYLILGSIMDIFSVFVITIPIMFPVITALGFDPIWFGILSTWLFEIGALTPPIGINVFVLKNTVADIPLEEIFAGVMPFYIADMLMIIALVAFPQIATFLPSLMR